MIHLYKLKLAIEAFEDAYSELNKLLLGLGDSVQNRITIPLRNLIRFYNTFTPQEEEAISEISKIFESRYESLEYIDSLKFSPSFLNAIQLINEAIADTAPGKISMSNIVATHKIKGETYILKEKWAKNIKKGTIVHETANDSSEDGTSNKGTWWALNEYGEYVFIAAFRHTTNKRYYYTDGKAYSTGVINQKLKKLYGKQSLPRLRSKTIADEATKKTTKHQDNLLYILKGAASKCTLSEYNFDKKATDIHKSFFANVLMIRDDISDYSITDSSISTTLGTTIRSNDDYLTLPQILNAPDDSTDSTTPRITIRSIAHGDLTAPSIISPIYKSIPDHKSTLDNTIIKNNKLSNPAIPCSSNPHLGENHQSDYTLLQKFHILDRSIDVAKKCIDCYIQEESLITNPDLAIYITSLAMIVNPTPITISFALVLPFIHSDCDLSIPLSSIATVVELEMVKMISKVAPEMYLKGALARYAYISHATACASLKILENSYDLAINYLVPLHDKLSSDLPYLNATSYVGSKAIENGYDLIMNNSLVLACNQIRDDVSRLYDISIYTVHTTFKAIENDYDIVTNSLVDLYDRAIGKGYDLIMNNSLVLACNQIPEDVSRLYNTSKYTAYIISEVIGSYGQVVIKTCNQLSSDLYNTSANLCNAMADTIKIIDNLVTNDYFTYFTYMWDLEPQCILADENIHSQDTDFNKQENSNSQEIEHNCEYEYDYINYTLVPRCIPVDGNIQLQDNIEEISHPQIIGDHYNILVNILLYQLHL